MNKIQGIFKKRGKKALDFAREEMLHEKIESKKARQALTYFMTKYWHDLARPSLMSIACEAVGGDPDLTTPIAVPMILISGAIDIHDDIIDESKQKDGRPTVYGKHGRDIALLIGDALLFKGLTLLNAALKHGIPSKKILEIGDIISAMFFELGDAEALELGFRRRLNVLPEDYLRLVRMKAADVEAHTKISAILAGASQKEIEALSEYGRLLGIMIILRDDMIDMMDLRESRARIKKECLPLPILYGLQDQKVGPRLRRILQRKTISRTDAENILQIITKSNAIRQYENLANELAKKALSRLNDIKLRKKDLNLLITATLPPTVELEDY